MAVGVDSQGSEIRQTKHGLSFNADGATLITYFQDEISAYRAKKGWVDVLHNYFLLDKDRDYDIWVADISESEPCYALFCYFDSACGRYAFWRLINHQSPEAELKLTNCFGIKKSVIRASKEKVAISEDDLPWVLNPEGKRKRKDTETFLATFMRLFS